MESIAQALEVEIKNLFEFAHLQAGGVKTEEIEKLLEGADEEKKRTIMKIVRAVVREDRLHIPRLMDVERPPRL